MQNPTLEELITKFKRPILVDQNGCWNWFGSISTQGYAIFNNKPMYGIVYTMSGRICPLDKVIRHKCANKKCINPEHIHDGTFSENMIDAIFDGARGLGRKVFQQIYDLYKRRYDTSRYRT